MSLAPRILLFFSFTLVVCGVVRAQEATPTPSEPAAERVYTFREVSKPAVILSMPDPAYQKSGAVLLDRSGAVKVSVVLSASGRVTNAQVLEGLSQGQNFAALKAARHITFTPAQKDGVPVSQSFVVSYSFTVTTTETGKPEELKGLRMFYLDTGDDREALGDLTAELQKLLPRLVLVDRPGEAECVLKFEGNRIRTFSETNTGRNGVPITVNSGRGWVLKPAGADKRRLLLYYVGVDVTAKSFARGFARDYKKANGLED
ncbi:MAG: TonB family protein [Acidobacteria bacterium]|nr:TonB family protein [Acidobacteriota bacterium]